METDKQMLESEYNISESSTRISGKYYKVGDVVSVETKNDKYVGEIVSATISWIQIDDANSGLIKLKIDDIFDIEMVEDGK